MQPLDKTLRNRLERTIKDARDIAEDAARAALEQLGVGEAAPFAHLSEQDREGRPVSPSGTTRCINIAEGALH